MFLSEMSITYDFIHAAEVHTSSDLTVGGNISGAGNLTLQGVIDVVGMAFFESDVNVIGDLFAFKSAFFVGNPITDVVQTNVPLIVTNSIQLPTKIQTLSLLTLTPQNSGSTIDATTVTLQLDIHLGTNISNGMFWKVYFGSNVTRVFNDGTVGITASGVKVTPLGVSFVPPTPYPGGAEVLVMEPSIGEKGYYSIEVVGIGVLFHLIAG